MAVPQLTAVRSILPPSPVEPLEEQNIQDVIISAPRSLAS